LFGLFLGALLFSFIEILALIGKSALTVVKDKIKTFKYTKRINDAPRYKIKLKIYLNKES
jgi:hypothetical protein